VQIVIAIDPDSIRPASCADKPTANKFACRIIELNSTAEIRGAKNKTVRVYTQAGYRSKRQLHARMYVKWKELKHPRR
jgi:hypothetical protein